MIWHVGRVIAAVIWVTSGMTISNLSQAAPRKIELPTGHGEIVLYPRGEPAYIGHSLFPSIQNWASVRIRLERSGCLGTCPAYTVEIAGSGRVSFEGFECVARYGRATAMIAPMQVRNLVQEFNKARFLDLRPKFAAAVTDGPTYRVTFAADGWSKTVEDYVGLEDGMPKSVRDLQDAIDITAGTDRWAHGPAARCTWDKKPIVPLKFAIPGRT